MVRKLAPIGLGLFATLVLAAGFAPARSVDDPPTIKQIMKEAMKGGLTKTVISGGASVDQQKELLRLMEALAADKPPRGEQASWDKLTKALVDASKSVVDGKADASAALKTAANCKACHDLHKGQ